MTTMRAMVTARRGDYDVMRPQEVPRPVPGPRDVLVRNDASGVCYHDHLIRAGVMKRGIRFPLILGHEGVGVVEAVGEAVRSLEPGDRVACSQWTEACGLCRFCRTSREPLCSARKFFGHDRDGTDAERFKIQEDSLLPLPAEIGFEEGAVLSCAIGTAAAIRDGGRAQAGAPEETLAHHQPMGQTPEQRPLAALARLGIRPEDIDIVINTHLHWDHCYNNHLFPRATIYAQRAELQYAIAPLPLHTWAYDTIEYEPARVVLPPFLRAHLTLVEGDVEIAPGVSILLTPGHTAGSQSVVVQGRKTWVLAGDNVPTYENLPGRFTPHFTPNGIHVNLEDYYRSWNRLARLGGEILPSHDARVLDRERYE